MKNRVLITGGAGFIGTHLTRRLLREGCSVSVLDCFAPQVHGEHRELAPDVSRDVRLFRGDVRDPDLVLPALENQDVVVHLAAETGTGQSMYEVRKYQDVNIGGTANLLEALVNRKASRVRKVVVASSRAVYGEGQYGCTQHGTVYPKARAVDDLLAGDYEPRCPSCREECVPQPTSEEAPFCPLSFYGLTKQVQEQMVLMFGRTCSIPAYALRYQNVYGPGQSLSNPYTGILSIFFGLAKSESTIQVFEDGQESRDFVFVDDVVEATWHFIGESRDLSGSYNVGRGERTTVLQVAKDIVRFFDNDTPVEVTGAFREGDIRHNFADLARIHAATGFTPQFNFRQGLMQFLEWATEQDGAECAYESSLCELRERGLLRG
jgi:dTDP-L-rhamnose 4-epimerase